MSNFNNETFKYYVKEIQQRDLKKVYEKIKDIEVLNIYLLEYLEELKKELYI